MSKKPKRMGKEKKILIGIYIAFVIASCGSLLLCLTEEGVENSYQATGERKR